MRITLSGDLGSGKSSVGRRLAEILGVPHYSAGSLFREIGRISNLDALRTNLAAENNVEIDNAVDSRTRDLDRTVPSFVIDARMAWHFVTGATKVYLSVSPLTAAERIMADGARGSETYASVAAAVAALAERRASETKRYRRLYGGDITDAGNYDLFIITDDAAIEDIADVIVAAAKGKLPGKYWLPRTRVVPMIAPPDGASGDAAGPLPLMIADNFGFHDGDAAALVASLASGLPLVRYEPVAGSTDLMVRAKRTVKPGMLDAWRKATGVDFAFSRVLGSATAA